MLFSEPKIPQSYFRGGPPDPVLVFQCSSASRKFLNRSGTCGDVTPAPFQCSSASRKFLNTMSCSMRKRIFRRFSALQRAENSSMLTPTPPQRHRASFSALQRAENSSIAALIEHQALERARFSALQRAENSSIPTLAPASIHIPDCDDHASSFLSLPGASP